MNRIAIVQQAPDMLDRDATLAAAVAPVSYTHLTLPPRDLA